jgi:hypothetical protein
MAKGNALGVRLLVGGYDISGDVNSIDNFHGGPAVEENTGIDKEAVEREALLVDGGFEFTSFFNKTAGQSHPVLSTLPTTDRIVSYLHKSVIGNPGCACVGKQIDYAPTRAASGRLVMKTTVQANGFGLEWGTQLTAGIRTDTGATNGAAVDFAQANSFGLQAYLQVTAFSGTDATVKLQMDDNSGFTSATDVTGGGFTQITAGPTSERIQTARNFAVERYLRVATVTTGGFSSLAFSVIVVVNTTSVVF